MIFFSVTNPQIKYEGKKRTNQMRNMDFKENNLGNDATNATNPLTFY